MGMAQIFTIKKWHYCSEINQIALSSIPKMLKRRLSPLAKLVLSAASPCVTDNQPIQTLFSSTHGELAKSFAMMQLIEKGEDISPIAFSLSVHNAIAGLFAIVYNNQLPTTVIAPGEEGLAAAFLEAQGILAEGVDQVLIVFYDEPLVDFYPAEPFQLTTQESCAVALLISKTGIGLPLRFSYLSSTGNDGEQPVQLPRLIHFLQQPELNRLVLKTPRHSWCWEKI